MFNRLAGQVEEETKIDALPAELKLPPENQAEDSVVEPSDTGAVLREEQSEPTQLMKEPAVSTPPETPTPPPIAIAAEPQVTPVVPPRRGRAPGKRSDPNYTQIGAYIPKELDRAVKRALVDEDNLDLSELIAQLLDDWVKRKIS